jgi:hypothetical protein
MKTIKIDDKSVGLNPKSKTQNKGTKTKTQRLKPRKQSMHDQSTNKIFSAITLKKKINTK